MGVQGWESATSYTLEEEREWKNSSCMFVGVRLRFGGWKCSGVEEQIVQVFLSCD